MGVARLVQKVRSWVGQWQGGLVWWVDQESEGRVGRKDGIIRPEG